MQFDKRTGKLIMPERTMPLTEDNIVFKCNWNDAGWKGICSKKARDYNVLKKHRWSINPNNGCGNFIKNGKKEFPCYESHLFIDFVMEPGTYLKGEKGLTQEDKYIRGGERGKLAFLTTISPDVDEKNRYFIGILDIEKIEHEREVYGNKKTSIIISPKIRLKFWNYFKNKDGSLLWGCGLVRYLDDEIALKILFDLKKEYDKLLGFEKEKRNLDILIKRYKKYLNGG
jgi:hypothetical protein